MIHNVHCIARQDTVLVDLCIMSPIIYQAFPEYSSNYETIMKEDNGNVLFKYASPNIPGNWHWLRHFF